MAGEESGRGQDAPLGGYAAVTSTFVLAVLAFAAMLRLRRRPLPSNVSLPDVLLLGLATHKIARLIAKDRVTAWLRAPVATLEGQQGPGEVASRPRGRGVRRAVGELVTCPFCVGQWVAAALVGLFVVAPRAARVVAAVFAARAVADFLQFGYARAEQAAEG